MYRNTSLTPLHPHILSQKWEPRVPAYSLLFLSRTQAQGKNLEFESEMNSIKDKVSMRDPQCTRMMGGFVIHATFPLV